MLAWVVMFRRHHRHALPIPVSPHSNCWPSPPSFLFVFHLPYALPSSVSRIPFVCHSYENCRGVYQQFPLWTRYPSTPSSEPPSRGILAISSRFAASLPALVSVTPSVAR